MEALYNETPTAEQPDSPTAQGRAGYEPPSEAALMASGLVSGVILISLALVLDLDLHIILVLTRLNNQMRTEVTHFPSCSEKAEFLISLIMARILAAHS